MQFKVIMDIETWRFPAISRALTGGYHACGVYTVAPIAGPTRKVAVCVIDITATLDTVVVAVFKNLKNNTVDDILVFFHPKSTGGQEFLKLVAAAGIRPDTIFLGEPDLSPPLGPPALVIADAPNLVDNALAARIRPGLGWL
jgi:hypothetical protein